MPLSVSRKAGGGLMEAAGEFEERLVDVGPRFPSDANSPEAVQPGEGAIDHPPVSTQPSAVPVGDQAMLRAGPASFQSRSQGFR